MVLFFFCPFLLGLMGAVTGETLTGFGVGDIICFEGSDLLRNALGFARRRSGDRLIMAIFARVESE